MKLLGLVMKSSNVFSPNTLKVLYCSLLRSTAEYFLLFEIHNIKIKFVNQREFRVNLSDILPIKQAVLQGFMITQKFVQFLTLDLLNTEHCRIIYVFLFKITSTIICPDLLKLFSFNVPDKWTCHEFIYAPCAMNAVTFRLMKLGNLNVTKLLRLLFTTILLQKTITRLTVISFKYWMIVFVFVLNLCLCMFFLIILIK